MNPDGFDGRWSKTDGVPPEAPLNGELRDAWDNYQSNRQQRQDNRQQRQTARQKRQDARQDCRNCSNCADCPGCNKVDADSDSSSWYWWVLGLVVVAVIIIAIGAWVWHKKKGNKVQLEADPMYAPMPAPAVVYPRA